MIKSYFIDLDHTNVNADSQIAFCLNDKCAKTPITTNELRQKWHLFCVVVAGTGGKNSEKLADIYLDGNKTKTGNAFNISLL